MYKKLIALLLSILFLTTPLFAEAKLSYEPYGEEEFPIWTMELRRAECIFFGSMVITYPIASLVYGLLADNGIISSPAEGVNRVLQNAAIASALSFTITTADYVIGKKQSNDKK
ncbi:MAG: hypothetical protein K6G51_00880 [Sphaerochaetaceae bacterium]|nr:hypothetical protein [Sphaerochaetaceae bacterium]